MIAFITVANDRIGEQYQAWALQKALVSFYQQFTPYLEAYRPTEFFLDLGREEEARSLARRLWEGLIPAYGQKAVLALAPSKLLARALSLLETRAVLFPELVIEEKPQGLLLFLPAGREEAVRRKLPLEVLWPLEEKFRERLLKMGFQTWGEIAALSPSQLKIHLGPEAYLAWDLAHGRWSNSLRLPPEGLRVPIYREEEEADLRAALEKGVERLAQALAARWLGCRELILAGKDREGRPFAQKRLFTEPCSSPASLTGETFRLWHKLGLTAPPQEMYLEAGGLEPMTVKQLNLFSRPAAKIREERLEKLLARLRKDYPAGFLDRASRWGQSRRERMLAFYDPWRFRREAHE